MLLITCSGSYFPERQYICRVLLKDILGIDYHICVTSCKNWHLQGEDGSSLFLPDIFFNIPENEWLTEASLPKQPLEKIYVPLENNYCCLIDSWVPVIYGDSKFNFNAQGSSSCYNDKLIEIDIFGSAFFMLSRYEEVVKSDSDEHGRFPASASLAYQEGFLDRPIINEYIEILWSAIKNICLCPTRRKRGYRNLVSCDIDQPYLGGIKNYKKQIWQTSGDILKRKNLKTAFYGVVNYFAVKRGCFSYDANHCAIEWMMDTNEAVGNRLAFYFMATRSNHKMDNRYSIDEPIIDKLMQKIHERGHEIGLHASYVSYLDKHQTVNEANCLRRRIDELKIHQESLGGRQHYLRWKTPDTARNLAAAGVSYDSTLGFADHAGFRCGICYEYSAYDPVARQELNLTIRPLIAMEISIVDKTYMGLDLEHTAYEEINKLRSNCRKFCGDFTLLWHNSSLVTSQMMRFYEKIVGP